MSNCEMLLILVDHATYGKTVIQLDFGLIHLSGIMLSNNLQILFKWIIWKRLKKKR